MKYVVVYEDRFGRVIYGECESPEALLDLAVRQGHLTAKKRKDARILRVVEESTEDRLQRWADGIARVSEGLRQVTVSVALAGHGWNQYAKEQA